MLIRGTGYAFEKNGRERFGWQRLADVGERDTNRWDNNGKVNRRPLIDESPSISAPGTETVLDLQELAWY